MSRPIQALIHLDALAHNLRIAQDSAPDAQVYAVVKANAYGHGIARVYEAFKHADGFALLDIAEAKQLRALGWQGDILLLEGLFSVQDLLDCHQFKLSFTVHSIHQIEWLRQFQYSYPQAKLNVFVKMNSGMNRLGFRPEAYRRAWLELEQLDIVRQLTHMMHFSDADGERFGKSGIQYQYELFQQVIQDFPAPLTVSNSAAILRHSEALRSDIVRSGIMLYGSSPDYPLHTIQDWKLLPAMSLRSEIIGIQSLVQGQSVGYGSRFIADQPMRIGIVACGYADGYQRISPTGTPVLVNGVRTRLIGRVSMDMLAVDVTEIAHADIGSEVVLWGNSSCGAVLPIDEVAQASGTVGYELMCAVTQRVPFAVQPASAHMKNTAAAGPMGQSA
ncbi:alanine racemase [Acinetobacter pragensis]|uniref:alanine racemase n=1 Tax=Acinetobacter pragensis TaxID=1806892 RepID=UPI00333FF91F